MADGFCQLDIWCGINKWCGRRVEKKKSKFVLKFLFDLGILSRAMDHDDVCNSIMQTVKQLSNMQMTSWLQSSKANENTGVIESMIPWNVFQPCCSEQNTRWSCERGLSTMLVYVWRQGFWFSAKLYCVGSVGKKTHLLNMELQNHDWNK